MAKDDYDVIVYKILAYLYACLKGKTVFDTVVFRKAVVGDDVTEEYLQQILRMMLVEGLIEGLTFTHAWGNDWILISDYSSARIKPNGIHYLTDNGKAKKIKQAILDGAGIVANLIKLLAL